VLVLVLETESSSKASRTRTRTSTSTKRQTSSKETALIWHNLVLDQSGRSRSTAPLNPWPWT